MEIDTSNWSIITTFDHKIAKVHYTTKSTQCILYTVEKKASEIDQLTTAKKAECQPVQKGMHCYPKQ